MISHANPHQITLLPGKTTIFAGTGTSAYTAHIRISRKNASSTAQMTTIRYGAAVSHHCLTRANIFTTPKKKNPVETG
ncbi:hypothetical protein [Desulfofundulus kuznetsovii]|uniref:hypothetical protein n=1 Tax=Desulfofundulus kuznetsovii TaxID=58135 RepID=UPI00338ED903